MTELEIIRANVEKILNILQGSDANGGLVTKVSNHSKYWKILVGVVTLIVTGRIAWGIFMP